DLPPDYLSALAQEQLVPLWPSLRALIPPHLPARQTRPTHWRYQGIRPLLMRAGELTPIEKAERRVLVLANPGLGLERLQASPAIYLGMQLLLPGEIAPSHRHTPNAVRMVVEGEGAYTTVDGRKCPMARGDLILTPTGMWHEHGHEGDAPVVWLDVLDLPVVVYLEASYHVNGPHQDPLPLDAQAGLARSGLLPTQAFERSDEPYPMLRYAYQDTLAALQSLATARPLGEAVLMSFVNPQTGRDVQNILGFHALMLRAGETVRLPARSPASVFHLIEGQACVKVLMPHGSGVQMPKGSGNVAGNITGNLIEHSVGDFMLEPADTCCAPGYCPIELSNPSATENAVLFLADESPLHRKLGLYEVRS
ncbi:MAG: cupin domain-containing protein, partial [Burkholderiaceae bacterium]